MIIITITMINSSSITITMYIYIYIRVYIHIHIYIYNTHIHIHIHIHIHTYVGQEEHEAGHHGEEHQGHASEAPRAPHGAPIIIMFMIIIFIFIVVTTITITITITTITITSVTIVTIPITIHITIVMCMGTAPPGDSSPLSSSPSSPRRRENGCGDGGWLRARRGERPGGTRKRPGSFFLVLGTMFCLFVGFVLAT